LNVAFSFCRRSFAKNAQYFGGGLRPSTALKVTLAKRPQI
jgi:hypothetical protein